MFYFRVLKRMAPVVRFRIAGVICFEPLLVANCLSKTLV